jgi:SAM-dependent methyltransferase
MAGIELPETTEALEERRLVSAGALPPRYGEPWAQAFMDRVAAAMVPGAQVLDVGSGRRPAVPQEARPDRVTYVGADVSAAELEAAEPGAYDRTIVLDLPVRRKELEEGFDLILSWQVLEHVKPLDVTLDNLHAYLRPGGRLVALLSGRFSAYAVLSRLIPYGVRVRAMERLLGTPRETKFPTHYDHCYQSALERMLSGWSQAEVIPRYKAGGYFRFWGPLQRAYLVYENANERRDLRNLATHYLVAATK